MLKLTKEEFRKRVTSAVASVQIDQYGADIFQVQDDYLVQTFGEDFYLDLVAKYEAGTATTKQLELVEILFDAIAPLAQASFLPLQPLQISERGAHIVSSSDEKTPFEHQMKSAIQAFMYKGFQAIERALRFLEANIDHPDFSLWALSDACTLYKQHTIANAAEFNEQYGIGKSRRTFLALLPTIAKTEEFHLEATIGEAFWDVLQEQLKDRDVTLENKILLKRYIRPAIAHLTVSAALETGGFKMEGEALELIVESTSDGLAGPMLQSKIASARRDGNAYLAKLKTFLNTNASATSYAAYFNSKAYAAPGSANNFNTATSKIFSTF